MKAMSVDETTASQASEHAKMREMNEALVLGAVHQHELTETAENLNTQLRASGVFSRSIIESSPDCIKALDLEGHLLSVESGQELLGIEDIRPYLHTSWIDFWTGEDRTAAHAAVRAAAAGGDAKFVGFPPPVRRIQMVGRRDFPDPRRGRPDRASARCLARSDRAPGAGGYAGRPRGRSRPG